MMCILVLAAAPARADDPPRWYEPFFVEAAVQYHFTPGLFSEVVKPDPGFRAALGYEFRRFRFAVESGYTHINGINPVVLDITFVPLVFKLGYALPIGRGFGLQADMSIGRMFSQTLHYDSAINVLLENTQDSAADSFLSGIRLYGTWSLLKNVLKFYAGGGVDMLFENDGVIPLPLIEAGISCKPLSLIQPKGGKAQNVIRR